MRTRKIVKTSWEMSVMSVRIERYRMSQESVLSKSIIGRPLHVTSIGNFNKKQSKPNILSGTGESGKGN